MSPRRKLGRRDANEATIIETLRSAGVVVYQLDHPVDLLVVRGNLLRLLEVKDPLKHPSQRKLTKEEPAFHRLWGDHACVVHTPTEALEAVGAKGKTG